jgi:hypothetical protein
MLLTKWTIRLALACYVAYLATASSARARSWHKPRRAVWTLGCAFFVVHVACAFHFFHHWSHTAAWQSTAERTHDFLGVAFGDGIYFSYLFGVLWLVDVAWLWLSPRARRPQLAGSLANPVPGSATCVPQRPGSLNGTPRWRLLVHLFLFFVAVNGAIVFEAGPTRWAGIAVLVALGCLVVRRTAALRMGGETSAARETVHNPAAAAFSPQPKAQARWTADSPSPAAPG